MRRRFQRYLNALLVSVLIVRAAAALVSTSGIGWDFAGYHRVGRAVLEGQKVFLYARSPLYTYYGFPLTAYAFIPLAMMPRREALALFKGCDLVWTALALALLYAPFRRRAGPWLGGYTLTAYLAIALAYGPVWTLYLSGGQVTPLAFLLLVAFYRLYTGGSLTAAALSLSASILLKPVLAPMLAVFLAAGETGLLRRAGLFLAAAGAVSVTAFGLQRHWEWLGVLHQAAQGQLQPWWNNSSAWHAIETVWASRRLGSVDFNATLAAPMVWLIVPLRLAALLALLRMARIVVRETGHPAERRHRLALIAPVAALAFSPIVWPHYLMFLLLPLVFLLFPGHRRPAASTALIWLAFLAAIPVQPRGIEYRLLDLFPSPVAQGIVAGIFASATMLALLIAFTAYHRHLFAPDGQAEEQPACAAV